MYLEEEKKTRYLVNFTRLVDDLFDTNLFLPYYISHKNDRNTDKIIVCIESIVNESIEKILTKDEKNLLFERYGIRNYIEYVRIMKLALKHGVDYTLMINKLRDIVLKLTNEDHISNLKEAFFVPEVNRKYTIIEDFFDKNFTKVYYDELKEQNLPNSFEVWKVFEKYSKS